MAALSLLLCAAGSFGANRVRINSQQKNGRCKRLDQPVPAQRDADAARVLANS
jgi:hypothetical protein